MSIPNVSEEINRKTIFAIRELLHLKSIDRISDAEFQLGVRAVWNTASGLVSDDTMSLLSGLMSQEIDGSNEVQVWAGKQKLLAVIWNRWMMSVEIRSLIGDKTSTTKTVDPVATQNPHQEVAEYIKKVELAMVATGMRKLWG
jgi:hypothetical protein